MDSSTMRKLKYKQLLDRGGELRETLNEEGTAEIFERISEIVKETDLINKAATAREHADNTTEIALDAQVIKMSHELVGTVLQKMSSSEYSSEELYHAIISVVHKTETPDWDAIAKSMVSLIKTARVSSCLLGSFEHDPTPVEKAVKHRSQKKQLTQEKRPETVEKLKKQDIGSKKLSLILKQIVKISKENRNSPIPYYQLIIDPNNFMNTIDNAFQVSFLVRNCLIELDVGDDGFPVVKVRPNGNPQDAIGGQVTQAISKLNPKIVKEMIEHYGIERPMIILDREALDDNLDLTQVPGSSR